MSWSLNVFTILRIFEVALECRNRRRPWNPDSVFTNRCPLKLYLIPPPGALFTNIFCLAAKTVKSEVHFREGQKQKRGTAEE